MVTKAKALFRNLVAFVVRVLFIFLVLAISLDSLTRIYYSYMPVKTWVDFQSVDVKMVDGVASAVIVRKTNNPAISMFHRTLLIRYPEESRGCTNSTVIITDDPASAVVTVPLDRMLSEGCPDALGKQTVDAVLQVSYIFDFPYGVKRIAIRYSNRFSLWYDGSYQIGPPIH